jgi:spore germination cell wall hydrolase CwlJ-like protein
VLFWPSDSCSNTGKGKIKQKVPSVVTSDLWKNYHNAKENHKQKQKEQVELRRLQREKRKKAQKEKNEKKIKKGKQTKSKKDANKTDTRQEYKCYKCQSEWKTEHFFEKKTKWLKSISCSNAAHQLCIPRKYLQH